MGIPAAFRWLSKKYPKIISPVIEDLPKKLDDGSEIPVDTTQPNPNGEEFDNLYLDMNGIVHPCSHPEDRPAPKDEEEMMLEIFRYTDRVVNMVRPRKILMIAVDGVAPRAKMNQQRSRRFRSAQEAQEKEEAKQELMKMVKQQGGNPSSPEDAVKQAFDSNSITPGTPFMDILAASLRYWCSYKLNTDPAWANLKVIISDATVPGEGEHKVMDFVRSQRASPDHDPNTRHVIYGLDADLIMLALATHEPHFRVLREDVFFQESKMRLCKLCGQKGHDAFSCKGEEKKKEGEFDEKENALPLKPFIWLHISALREYLAVELFVPDLPFRFDLERVIDDWIFLCCFVGNDFLPHLPALEIRENGIQTLTAIWRDNLPTMGGYVTRDGHIDLKRAQIIMNGLAKQEDAIFRRRKQQEDRREANNKRRKLQDEARNGGQEPKWKRHNVDQAPSGFNSLKPIGDFAKPRQITHDMVVSRNAVNDANQANKSAASVLKGLMASQSANPPETPKKGLAAGSDTDTSPSSVLGKRKSDMMADDTGATPTASTPGGATPASASGADEGPVDTVRMWEHGYQDRYYEQKFHVDPKDIAFRHKVAEAYVEGLAWVLLYYFQGCPSWSWYYPYHYAPFAKDFVNLEKMDIKFEKGRISKPFEQLMCVMPAASRRALPDVFHPLMTDKDSEIIDFYPEDFEVDLNGKKFAWQGVALLPFIDMPRLLKAVQSKYPELSPEDAARNGVGNVVMILSDGHSDLYSDITSRFYSKKQKAPSYDLDPRHSHGLTGTVKKMDDYLPHGALEYPLERKAMPSLDYDRSLTVFYEIPSTGQGHKSMLLRGVKMPKQALDRNDIEVLKRTLENAGRSYGGVPLGRDGNTRGERINYGPGNNSYQNGRGGYNNYSNNDRGGYNSYNNDRYQGRPPRDGPPPHRGDYHRNDYQQHQQPRYPAYPPQPPQQSSWVPPPPGHPNFGSGYPPPPPPSSYDSRQFDSRQFGAPGTQSYNHGPPGVSQPPPSRYSGPPAGQGRAPPRGGGGYGRGRGGGDRGGYSNQWRR